MEHVAIGEVVTRLARKTGLAEGEVRAVLQAQAELAYELAGEVGYPVPGIGVLAKAERPERRMVLRFGPRKGEEVVVPPRKVLAFRVAKVAKDVVIRRDVAPVPDVMAIEMSAPHPQEIED